MNVENIIRPNGALTSLKSLLIPLYIQDYGIENKGIIYERLRNAIFIFDSDPIVTEKFVAEHLSEIKNSSFIR